MANKVYTISWSIEIAAKDHHQAGVEAVEFFNNPQWTGTMFNIVDTDGKEKGFNFSTMQLTHKID